MEKSEEDFRPHRDHCGQRGDSEEGSAITLRWTARRCRGRDIGRVFECLAKQKSQSGDFSCLLIQLVRRQHPRSSGVPYANDFAAAETV
jgi:hypothetical protein